LRKGIVEAELFATALGLQVDGAVNIDNFMSYAKNLTQTEPA